MEGLYIFIYILIRLLFGLIALKLSENKNISGFWLGVLLGVLGIIIVACVPYNYGATDNVKPIDNNQDKYEKLQKIAALRDLGALTQEEFEIEKQRILKRL